MVQLTILADNIALISISLLCLILLIVALHAPYEKIDTSHVVANSLTDNRFLLFLGTALAILAVDFPAFPRRLAKTELYGFSMMDVGVGLFGLYYGMFAKEVRVPPQFLDIRGFLRSVKSLTPIGLMALGRLVAIKISGYPEHITEYGVHWNFFFTLTFVRLFASFFVLLLPFPNFMGTICMTSLLFYNNYLTTHDQLNDWVIDTPDNRINLSFVDQNKEGIVSLPGFITLYFVGMQLGSYFYPLLLLSKEKTMTLLHCIKVTIYNFVALICSGAILYYSHTKIQPCSRRLANFTYVSWVLMNFFVTMTVGMVGSILVALVHSKSQNNSISSWVVLPNAFNKNALALFLLANLLTGCVNLTIPTIDVPDNQAVTILLCYCFVICFIASFLYHKKITLKFW